MAHGFSSFYSCHSYNQNHQHILMITTIAIISIIIIVVVIFIFSEGALIPTHQSGKALYYNSIKTELKSPQKPDQTKNQQLQAKQQQQQQPKATKVVFSNGGVNTALHDDAEHAITENGKLSEKAPNGNGKVVENGNLDKGQPESTQYSNERLEVDVSNDCRRGNGTAHGCTKESSLTNGHSKSRSEVGNEKRKTDDDSMNVAMNGHHGRRRGSSNCSSNCSSPTNNEPSSLPTPRRSLPAGRYSALVAREREGSECLSETSSVLTTTTPINCSPQVQRRTEEEEEVRSSN